MLSTLVKLPAALLGKMRMTGPASPTAGAPPVQVVAVDHLLSVAPVQTWVAGATRSSRPSRKGRADKGSRRRVGAAGANQGRWSRQIQRERIMAALQGTRRGIRPGD